MRKYLQRGIIIGIVSASICSASFAATVVERRDIQGKTEIITLENKQVHIQNEDKNYYSLMDLGLKKAYLVDANKKRIVEMDIEGKPPQLPEGKKPPWFGKQQQPVNAYLVKKSSLTIAGQFSRHYQIGVYFQNKRKICFDSYFSERATQIPYLVDFLNAMSDMSKSRKIEGMPVHPCIQALDDLESRMKKLGVPMKTVIKGNKGEKVKHEILSIQKNVNVSPKLFKLPKNYNKISEQEKREEDHKEMMRRMEEAQKRGYNSPPFRR